MYVTDAASGAVTPTGLPRRASPDATVDGDLPVQALEALGHAERGPNPDDGRSFLIRLTRKGQRLLDLARPRSATTPRRSRTRSAEAIDAVRAAMIDLRQSDRRRARSPSRRPRSTPSAPDHDASDAQVTHWLGLALEHGAATASSISTMSWAELRLRVSRHATCTRRLVRASFVRSSEDDPLRRTGNSLPGAHRGRLAFRTTRRGLSDLVGCGRRRDDALDVSADDGSDSDAPGRPGRVRWASPRALPAPAST